MPRPLLNILAGSCIGAVLVAVASVPDLKYYDTIYQERYMGIPKDNEEGYRIGSPINFAEGLEGGLLIIHGTADEVVPYRHGKKIYELAKCPKRMVTIKGGTHNELELAAPWRFWGAINTFLEKKK
mgnify:CR=1 FL=1